MAGMMWKIDENLTTGILCPSSLEFLSSLTNFSDITFIKKKKNIYIYIYIYISTLSLFLFHIGTIFYVNASRSQLSQTFVPKVNA